MHRPIQSQEDVELHGTDQLEGETGSVDNTVSESATSAGDAGLDERPWTEVDRALDADFDDGPPFREIPFSDIEGTEPGSRIRSPELSDYNAPGEVDIEELDEGDLDGTNLPPDARLDPLEP